MRLDRSASKALRMTELKAMAFSGFQLNGYPRSPSGWLDQQFFVLSAVSIAECQLQNVFRILRGKFGCNTNHPPSDFRNVYRKVLSTTPWNFWRTATALSRNFTLFIIFCSLYLMMPPISSSQRLLQQQTLWSFQKTSLQLAYVQPRLLTLSSLSMFSTKQD